MSDFIKGSSVLAALPTLLYLGFYQRRNRLNALNSSSDIAIKTFLSIPYESIVVGVPLIFGLAYFLMKKSERNSDDPNKKNIHTGRVILFGSSLGLILSIIGRFGFDLPAKLFGINEREYSVHIVAPIIYPFIFLYVDKLLSN